MREIELAPSKSVGASSAPSCFSCTRTGTAPSTWPAPQSYCAGGQQRQPTCWRLGTPEPRGDIYFVADLEFVEHLPAWADSIDLELLTANVRDGAPLVVTWWDVIRAASVVEPRPARDVPRA